MNADEKTDPGALLRLLDAEPVPADVANRLRRARAQAVARARVMPRQRSWAPGATAATALGLALVFLLRSPAPLAPPDLSADPQAAGFVFAGDDASLAEDLEFYHWLERHGHAG